MKFKKRFKRAVANFFREELLEYVGYKHELPLHYTNHIVKQDNIEFDVIKMQAIISKDVLEKGLYQSHQSNPTYELHDEIDRVKEDFAKKVVEHIYVDGHGLINGTPYDRDLITLSLRVQSKM